MEIGGTYKLEGKIYERLCGVMSGIRAVAKARDNKIQGYKFRGIDDVYNMIQPVLAENKVFIIPKLIEMIEEEKQSKAGGILYYTTLKMEYSFYTDDGSSITTQTIGKAMDSGDKSLDKAKSANMKYLLLQMFLIPTEDEKDTEEDSPETTGKVKGKSKTNLEILTNKYFKLANSNESERHTWQLENIGKESKKEWTEKDFQKAIELLEKAQNEHKPTALESLKANLDSINTLEELSAKWKKNKASYESLETKSDIISLYASRKHQLTIEYISLKTGHSLLMVQTYLDDSKDDYKAWVEEALAGNQDGVEMLKTQINSYFKNTQSQEPSQKDLKES